MSPAPALLATLLTLSSTVAIPTWAHGLPKPVYGGDVATEFDLGFELYFAQKKVLLYITDHDVAYDDSVFKSELMWKGLTRPLYLVPVGDGKLAAALPVGKACPSGEVVAKVVGQGIRKPLTVTFAPVGKPRC